MNRVLLFIESKSNLSIMSWLNKKISNNAIAFIQLSFSMEEMYDVVADVSRYKHFVPWCTESKVLMSRPGHIVCRLYVGFPPLNENYKASVTLVPHRLVRSECVEGKLFNYLLAIWSFGPGLESK
jgi:coenzyme Q-binding protein COQ10